jgi:hypothetical protein
MKRVVCVVFCLLCVDILTLNGLAQSGIITIRNVAGSGVSGYGGLAGPAQSSDVYGLTSVTADAAGNLYIAEPENYLVVSKVTPGELISTFSGDHWHPTGLAVTAAGVLYVTDPYNEVVHRVTPDGLIRTAAGTVVSNLAGTAARPPPPYSTARPASP